MHPLSFPRGTVFYLFEAEPVALYPDGSCRRWSPQREPSPGRDHVERAGTSITEQAFRASLAAIRRLHQRTKSRRPGS
jgi:hypothetical protein